jgi:hypothetical protein
MSACTELSQSAKHVSLSNAGVQNRAPELNPGRCDERDNTSSGIADVWVCECEDADEGPRREYPE